jgi:uncharacterized protein
MSNPASSSRADRAARRWYHERWPWFLIAGPAIVIVASLASAWLAVASDDGVVADDYYKQGLLINRKLGSGSVVAGPEPGAVVAVGNDGRVEVRLTYEGPAPTKLRLTLRHPGDRAQVVALASSADGVWVGTLAVQTPGRWIVALESDLWRLPVTTVQGQVGEIRLGAERTPW